MVRVLYNYMTESKLVRPVCSADLKMRYLYNFENGIPEIWTTHEMKQY